MRKLALAGLALLLTIGFAALVVAQEKEEKASEKSAAAAKTLSGTLTDSFCYMTMGAHGSSHKACAIECAKKGIPVMLRQRNGTTIVLLPNKDKQPLPDDVINKMEQEVSVTGKRYTKGGTTFLTVESVK